MVCRSHPLPDSPASHYGPVCGAVDGGRRRAGNGWRGKTTPGLPSIRPCLHQAPQRFNVSESLRFARCSGLRGALLCRLVQK